MRSNIVDMINALEDYLSKRPLIGDIIVDKYEIDSIYGIKSECIGSMGVQDILRVDVKIRGTFSRNWDYIYTFKIENYGAVLVKGEGIKRRF